MTHSRITVTFTVILAVATLVTALRAAWFWRRASIRMPRLIDHIPGSGHHVVQIDREAVDAALLNSKAAMWSGATAVLSALTAIWGATAPLLWP
jgi:hypothetical protein